MERSAAWQKPGPGSWELDASHSGPAPGPILRDLYERCLRQGMIDGLSLFGSPLLCMEMRWVNGKFYRRLVPLIGGGRDLPPPPAALLWLVSRVHPAFRRQERQARESFGTKRWRHELARWETEWKPQLTKANLQASDVDVATLTDDELASHLTELHDRLRESVTLHFRLHVSDMGPLGNLMVHLDDWGMSRADTFRALVKASPATRAPIGLLRRVAEAVQQAGVDLSTLATPDDVRAASPEATARLDEYMREYGWRITSGYDIEDLCLVEMPDVIVASIKAAAGSTDAAADDESSAVDALTSLRDEIPAEHRDVFDDLAEDARLSYGLRDENGPLTYEWPAGLLRRALLEAGRRLATASRLREPLDVFELTLDEVVGLVRGASSPGLAQIAERAAERAWWATLQPPPLLGPEAADPPVHAFPPNLQRITRVVLAVVDALEAAPGREPLHGLGIGTGTYVGPARVVRDAAEALASVEPGDVIVTPYTAPTYNAVLALAGAVVTEQGGLLSHAAVLARELGIPAVIGASEAMSRVPDGAMVEVDPAAGVVRIVG